MSVTCLEFRRRIGGEPNARDAALIEHRHACRACAAFQDRMQRFDGRIAAALELPVPEHLADRILFQARRRPGRPQRFAAIAATVLVLLSGVWTGARYLNTGSLPQAVVTHIEHEPDALMPVSAPVGKQHLDAVLKWGDARLDGDVGPVSYARLCYFRGHLMAHLVVPGPNGPVTVILLPHQQVAKPEPFHEDGFAGVIYPVEHGSIAVVSHRDAGYEPIVRRFASKVRWTL